MQSILPCHPKYLPKILSNSLLTLPLTISIVTPIEKVKFWQSDGLLVVSIIIALTLIIVSLFFSYNIYQGYETFENFQKILMITLIFNVFLFLCSLGLHVFNRHNNFNIPNNFFANKYTWQSQPIIQLFQNDILLYQPFAGTVIRIDIDEVEQFKFSQFHKAKPLKPIGLSFMLKNRAKIYGLKHYRNQNIFPFLGLVATPNFILNESQQITYKQVVQILEKYRASRTSNFYHYEFDDFIIS